MNFNPARKPATSAAGISCSHIMQTASARPAEAGVSFLTQLLVPFHCSADSTPSACLLPCQAEPCAQAWSSGASLGDVSSTLYLGRPRGWTRGRAASCTGVQDALRKPMTIAKDTCTVLGSEVVWEAWPCQLSSVLLGTPFLPPASGPAGARGPDTWCQGSYLPQGCFLPSLHHLRC